MKLSEQGVIILYRITGDNEAEIEREVTNEVAQLEAKDVICEDCAFRYGAEHSNEDGTYTCPLCEATQLEVDLEERTNQYHLAHAKISSRDAIIEQLSQEQLAKDVAQLESTIAEITKLAKEPIVSVAGGEHDDALLRLVRIIEVLEGE